MRPIVSFCGSPTYQLSRYFTTILQPLTDKSRRKLQSTENFIDAIKTVQIPDDYKLVSFDVKSLFTSIPLQLALQCTETAIQQSTVKLPLPTEDIMDLLNLCLTSTYFQYNGKHYKQLHGTAVLFRTTPTQTITQYEPVVYFLRNPLVCKNIFMDDFYPSGYFRRTGTIHPGIFGGRALWANSGPPRMSTIAPRDQFKPIRIGENLVVNYNL